MSAIYSSGRKAWIPLVLALSVLSALILFRQVRAPGSLTSFFARPGSLSPQAEIKILIERKYVDPISAAKLQSNDIDSLLQQLDPHSAYIPAAAVRQANEELQGNFNGIGVEFQILKDTVHVVTVMPKGPGQRAGLQMGDRFLQVGDSLVAGQNMTPARIRNMLRGPGKKTISLRILRNNQTLTLPVERDLIQVPAVEAAYLLQDTVGYIRLGKFSAQSYEETMAALESLQKKGMKALIFDLRQNGGGILSEAVDIADEFLDGDKMIVYTEGAHAKRQNYQAKRPGQFETGKLVVLIDEGSASASEVLCGALQDWDRATVVGRRSFGKGLVQEQFELQDGSALRLTIARYYTPSGRSIQKPYTDGFEAYENEIENRWKTGALQWADSNRLDKGKVFQSKQGKKIYGSGGIMPDEFVKLDSLFFTPWVDSVFAKNAIPSFAYSYFMANQNRLRDPSSIKGLLEMIYADEKNWWPQFEVHCAQQGIPANLSINPAQKAFVSNRIAANIVRYRFQQSGYYEVLNEDVFEPFVHRALQVINR